MSQYVGGEKRNYVMCSYSIIQDIEEPTCKNLLGVSTSKDGQKGMAWDDEMGRDEIE